MSILNSNKYKIYSKFLNDLAKKLTRFYFLKLDKKFSVFNKKKGKGYDPVTSADKAFEKFIRKEIHKKFPNHQIKGEEFGQKKTKSFLRERYGNLVSIAQNLTEPCTGLYFYTVLLPSIRF